MQPLGSTTRPHLCAFAWACFGSFVKDFMNHQFRLEAANLPPGRQMRWNDHASTLELPQSEVPVGGAVPTVGIFVSLALQRAQAGAAPSALSAAAPDTVDTTCTVWRTFTDEHGTATSQDAIRRHITAQARCVLGLSVARRLLRRHFLRWWSARVRACVDGVGCTACLGGITEVSDWSDCARGEFMVRWWPVLGTGMGRRTSARVRVPLVMGSRVAVARVPAEPVRGWPARGAPPPNFD